MASVINDPNDLVHASKELKNNKELIESAIVKGGVSCLEYVSTQLKDDKDIVLYCVSRSGNLLEYASERLKNDKDVVKAAILEKSSSIEYVSFELRDDKEIVLIAVKDCAENLCYASERLRNDKEIVLAAFENSDSAAYYVGENLRKEIRKNEPISYLKSALLYEELNNDIIKPRQENKAKPKL